MIDITKIQKLIAAAPAVIPFVKAIPQRLDDLGKARDAIMKAASPATAAFVGRVASKSTPFSVHVAIFGGGFVAGAVTAALFTPMRGDELRGVVKSEATNLWGKWTGEAEDIVDDASDAVDEAHEHVAGVTDEGAERVVHMRDRIVESSRHSLDALTRDELYERAREADIPGRSEMDKQQLLEALRARLN